MWSELRCVPRTLKHLVSDILVADVRSIRERDARDLNLSADTRGVPIHLQVCLEEIDSAVLQCNIAYSLDSTVAGVALWNWDILWTVAQHMNPVHAISDAP